MRSEPLTFARPSARHMGDRRIIPLPKPSLAMATLTCVALGRSDPYVGSGGGTMAHSPTAAWRGQGEGQGRLGSRLLMASLCPSPHRRRGRPPPVPHPDGCWVSNSTENASGHMKMPGLGLLPASQRLASAPTPPIREVLVTMAALLSPVLVRSCWTRPARRPVPISGFSFAISP